MNPHTNWQKPEANFDLLLIDGEFDAASDVEDMFAHDAHIPEEEWDDEQLIEEIA